MIGMLHHIEIYVNNSESTILFWDWFLQELGYYEYQNWEKGKSYKLKDTYLVFVQTEEIFIEMKYHRKNSGLNHLAFYGGSKDFVDELTTKLIQKKIPILYPEKHPFAENYYAVFFEDPDRIKVEVIANPQIFKEV